MDIMDLAPLREEGERIAKEIMAETDAKKLEKCEHDWITIRATCTKCGEVYGRE